ncbi:DUF11 domain-containing protein [Meiothermus rufus]|uniref:DUF11 domain-containing protein n=1 Tax=Meiothermus rufus TaxID=604332 RepID=UPI000488F294|nr:DUF11 domain-containing protein [Meiothermus rufus]
MQLVEAKRWWSLGLALLLALALAQRSDVRLELKAFRVLVVEEQGRRVERLEAALEAKPGELLEYQLSALNTSNSPLRQVALVIPIPPGTAYQQGSAQPLRLGQALVAPEFSFDGGRTYGQPPLKRKVRVVEGGKEVEKEVEVKPEEYTHVRWILPQMEAKQTVLLRLRVVVR